MFPISNIVPKSQMIQSMKKAPIFEIILADRQYLRGKSLLELWVPLFSPTDSHHKSLFDLLQNHMNTSHTIRVHAQEVWDKSEKVMGDCQSRRKVVTHNSKSDLPL